MDAQARYVQLGRLIEAVPAISEDGEVPREMVRWLGQAFALVRETGDLADMNAVKIATNEMDGRDPWSARNMVLSALHRALAVAELQLPVSAQGAFIPANQPFNALAALAKVLGAASKDMLLVDPYMDVKVVTDYLPLISEGVTIRLLADQQTYKLSLRPAVTAWQHQYASKRPLEARLTGPRVLHDRLVAVDNASVYTLTQSFNAFAQRSPATIVRVDSDTAILKRAAYEAMWSAAAPI